MRIADGLVLPRPNERLTWEEMNARYPDQWLGLKDVIYKDGDRRQIESAVIAEMGDIWPPKDPGRKTDIPEGEVIPGPAERMTWDEIKDRYPNEWVGLNDVKFKNDDGTNVESAVVAEIGDRFIIQDHLFDGTIMLECYTTPEYLNAFANWGNWL